jgi:hypothetical protein
MTRSVFMKINILLKFESVAQFKVPSDKGCSGQTFSIIKFPDTGDKQ